LTKYQRIRAFPFLEGKTPFLIAPRLSPGWQKHLLCVRLLQRSLRQDARVALDEASVIVQACADFVKEKRANGEPLPFIVSFSFNRRQPKQGELYF
jgi:hypothetical protein